MCKEGKSSESGSPRWDISILIGSCLAKPMQAYLLHHPLTEVRKPSKERANTTHKPFKNGRGVLSVRNHEPALTFSIPIDILPLARMNHLYLLLGPVVQILEPSGTFLIQTTTLLKVPQIIMINIFRDYVVGIGGCHKAGTM